MPWCEDCGRFFNPNTMRADGSCPVCGRVLGPAMRPQQGVDLAGRDAPPRAPWHFKLMVLALVLYLGWRLWEALVWLAGVRW